MSHETDDYDSIIFSDSNVNFEISKQSRRCFEIKNTLRNGFVVIFDESFF